MARAPTTPRHPFAAKLIADPSYATRTVWLWMRVPDGSEPQGDLSLDWIERCIGIAAEFGIDAAPAIRAAINGWTGAHFHGPLPADVLAWATPATAEQEAA